MWSRWTYQEVTSLLFLNVLSFVSAFLLFSVQGRCFETCGYTPSALVGENVAQLCPRSMSLQHKAWMKAYASAAGSEVVGHTRNREMLHFAGHCFPVSMEVMELSRRPLVFSATITEVECSRKGERTG